MLDALAPGRPDGTALGQPFAKRSEDRRLADAGLARDEKHLPAAPLREREGVQHLLDDRVAPDDA